MSKIYTQSLHLSKIYSRSLHLSKIYSRSLHLSKMWSWANSKSVNMNQLHTLGILRVKKKYQLMSKMYSLVKCGHDKKINTEIKLIMRTYLPKSTDEQNVLLVYKILLMSNIYILRKIDWKYINFCNLLELHLHKTDTKPIHEPKQ